MTKRLIYVRGCPVCTGRVEYLADADAYDPIKKRIKFTTECSHCHAQLELGPEHLVEREI